MTHPTPSILALIGLRCSGKTTVGRALAEHSGVPFVDLDEEVARAAGVPHVATLIERDGIDELRRLEVACLRELTSRADGPMVLSTGGGTVESEEARRVLEQEVFTVWLRAPLALLRERMRSDASNPRPSLVAEGDEFAVLDRRRAPWYGDVARLAIDVEGASPKELAARIEARWLRSE